MPVILSPETSDGSKLIYFILQLKSPFIMLGAAGRGIRSHLNVCRLCAITFPVLSCVEAIFYGHITYVVPMCTFQNFMQLKDCFSTTYIVKIAGFANNYIHKI